MQKKACVVAESYPTSLEPSFPFVEQLVKEFARRQILCTVIAPLSITKVLAKRCRYKKNAVQVVDGVQVKIFRPWYVSFSNTKFRFLRCISDFTFEKAINRVMKKLNNQDLVYCYFCHVGLFVCSVLLKNKINWKLCIQNSECSISIPAFLLKEEILNRVDKVVCVSKSNEDESLQLHLPLNDSKIIVNGYDPKLFYKKDRIKVRTELGFPVDSFIVIFVGGFIERKGVQELCCALDMFGEKEKINAIFIGKGALSPHCRGIVFCNSVNHDCLVDYLNCADLFVLPTKAEGCCNAIIEALACGLPVISSNKSFNDEILNDSCSIRINEQDVYEIYSAIKELYYDRARLSMMSQAAIKKAANLTISERASKIQFFIESETDDKNI